MIKAVIFDVDGVLLDSFEANFKFLSDLINHFGYNPPARDEYRKLFHMTNHDVIRIVTKSTNEEEIEKIWKVGKFREIPYPYHLLDIPSKLEETIKKLSKEYILGVVTSRTSDNVFFVPHLSNLEKYFKVVVGYEDTEKHKPHPDPLILSAQKINLLPEECVYVGDVENDVLAAKSAGMKSIIYSENNTHGADVNFSSFENLPELIESL